MEQPSSGVKFPHYFYKEAGGIHENGTCDTHGICLITQKTLSAVTFVFSALCFGCSMKKISESTQARYTPWDVFALQLQGSICALLARVSVVV